jgi:nicotinamidase-related amidase
MMADRIWDAYLSPTDKAVMAASGYGALSGFGHRPALLIVDVNRSFCGDGPEPILEAIKRWPTSCGAVSWVAIPVIKTLADAFRAKKLPVIYTTGQSRTDGWDKGSWGFKQSRIGETIKKATGPDGTEIVAPLAPQAQDIIVYKQKPSGFFGTNLAAYLTLLGADSVVVTGTTTSGCVRATVLDAFSLNYRVAVVEDGCFDRNEASHAINLCDMHAKYSDVIASAAVLDFVSGLADDLFPQLPHDAPPGGKLVAAE